LGGNLFERIIQLGNLPETDSASISSHLVSIIKYLHKNGIVIRNLRPEIIYFEDKDGLDIKLFDLSLSSSKENYKEGAIDWLFDEYQRQAPIYMAPELLV